MDIFNMQPDDGQNGRQDNYSQKEGFAKVFVDESPRSIRSIARTTLRGNWAEAFLALLITELVVSGPSYLLYKWTDSSVLALLLDLYGYMVTGATSLGLARYFLNISRQQPSTISDVFSGFKNLMSALLLYIVIEIKIFLWSLLFVIPGIIASYKYSQAFFFLADNPLATPGQCIAYSKMVMAGNKSRMFFLDLSFIGWAFLASLPGAALSAYYAAQYGEEFLANIPDITTLYVDEDAFLAMMKSFTDFTHSHPLIILMGLTGLFLNVYINASHAVFHDLASGQLIVRNE